MCLVSVFFFLKQLSFLKRQLHFATDKNCLERHSHLGYVWGSLWPWFTFQPNKQEMTLQCENSCGCEIVCKENTRMANFPGSSKADKGDSGGVSLAQMIWSAGWVGFFYVIGGTGQAEGNLSWCFNNLWKNINFYTCHSILKQFIKTNCFICHNEKEHLIFI